MIKLGTRVWTLDADDNQTHGTVTGVSEAFGVAKVRVDWDAYDPTADALVSDAEDAIDSNDTPIRLDDDSVSELSNLWTRDDAGVYCDGDDEILMVDEAHNPGEDEDISVA